MNSDYCMSLIRSLFIAVGIAASAQSRCPEVRAEERGPKALFAAASAAGGLQYSTLRTEMLKTPGMAEFLGTVEDSSVPPSKKLLAVVLLSRIANGEEFLKLEQEFHDKVVRLYYDFPDFAHPLPQRARVTLDGLLIPGEKSPSELEPKRFEPPLYAKYFESLRVSESPLWGVFCCEILLKGWAPAGKVQDNSPKTLSDGFGIGPISPKQLSGPAAAHAALLPSPLPAEQLKSQSMEQHQNQAMSLLGKLQEQRASSLLLQILRTPAAPPIHRAIASIALGRLRYQESLPVLLERCETPRDRIDALESQAAFAAVVLMKDLSAIPRLQAIVDGKVTAPQKGREVAVTVGAVNSPPSRLSAIDLHSFHVADAQRAIDELRQNH